MSILFKKSIKAQAGVKLQEGTNILKGKQISPYRRVTSDFNPEREKYITEFMGEGYTPKNVGYSYGYQRDPDFTKAYNTAVAGGTSYTGKPTDTMFTMYPGQSYTRGSRVEGGGYSYNLPRDTPGRPVTVEQYQKNPGAFKYATTGGTDFGQFDKYLGLQ